MMREIIGKNRFIRKLVEKRGIVCLKIFAVFLSWNKIITIRVAITDYHNFQARESVFYLISKTAEHISRQDHQKNIAKKAELPDHRQVIGTKALLKSQPL